MRSNWVLTATLLSIMGVVGCERDGGPRGGNGAVDVEAGPGGAKVDVDTPKGGVDVDAGRGGVDVDVDGEELRERIQERRAERRDENQ